MRKTAEKLYNVMNAIDCGCTVDHEEAVYLGDGSHVVFEEIEGTDDYRMVIVKPCGKRVIQRVGYVRDGSECDESTIKMFENIMNDYYNVFEV